MNIMLTFVFELVSSATNFIAIPTLSLSFSIRFSLFCLQINPAFRIIKRRAPVMLTLYKQVAKPYSSFKDLGETHGDRGFVIAVYRWNSLVYMNEVYCVKQDRLLQINSPFS